jgi:hypothetical protein
MKILCRNNKEVRVALAQLEKHGYRWQSGHRPTKLYHDYDYMVIMVHENSKRITMSDSQNDAVRASELYKNLLR